MTSKTGDFSNRRTVTPIVVTLRAVSLHITSLLSLAGLILLAGCAGNPYNPTVYPNKIETDLLKQSPPKTLLVAPVNFGKPSRLYLRDHEARIDEFVTNYLRSNGYKVISNRLFDRAWKESVREYGEVFNPTTGKLTATFNLVMVNTVKKVIEQSNVDAIVFTDLVDRQTQFSGGLNHVARWDGVTRKPSMQGSGDGVPVDFNWAQDVQAVSLMVNIVDKEVNRVFHGLGGIEVTQAISTRGSTPRWVRRRSVLNGERDIEEGVALAFHPFIVMEDYPRAEP